MSAFFEHIKAGLEEAIQHTRGQLHLRTTTVIVPPPPLSPKQIVRLRKRMGLTQREFAQLLNVGAKTVQSWERDQRRPTHAALRLLQVLDTQPATVLHAIEVRKPSPRTGTNGKAGRG